MSEANVRHVTAVLLMFSSAAPIKRFSSPERLNLTMLFSCIKIPAARSAESAEQCDDVLAETT